VSRAARLRWTLRARADLVAIGRYVARDDARAARRWLEKLRSKAREAAAAPRAGRRVPEVARDDVREMIVGSYRIVYRVERTGISVLTVFEEHRSFPRELGLTTRERSERETR